MIPAHRGSKVAPKQASKHARRACVHVCTGWHGKYSLTYMHVWMDVLEGRLGDFRGAV